MSSGTASGAASGSCRRMSARWGGGQSSRKTVQALLLPVVVAVQNSVSVQVGYPEGRYDLGIARGETLRDGWVLIPQASA